MEINIYDHHPPVGASFSPPLPVYIHLSVTDELGNAFPFSNGSLLQVLGGYSTFALIGLDATTGDYLYNTQANVSIQLGTPANPLQNGVYHFHFEVVNHPNEAAYASTDNRASISVYLGCGCQEDNLTILTQAALDVLPHHVLAEEKISIGGGTPVAVHSGKSYLFQAGEEVLLRDGFVAEARSNMRAFIHPCTPGIVERKALAKTAFSFQLYPNPTFDYIRCEIDMRKDEKVRISLLAISGEILGETEIDAVNEGVISHQWDVSSLASGLYFCHIQGKNRVETRYFIKQNP